MKTPEKTMWQIVMSNRCGWEHEAEYPNQEAAQRVLDNMRQSAEKRTELREKWLASHPQPWNEQDSHTAWVNGYSDSQTPIESFNARGWHLKEVTATPYVYRLNTLPADCVILMREIEAKVAMFGYCELSWTCTGHTRAEWQSIAAAEQLASAHPEWEVTHTSRDVTARVRAA